METFYDGDLKDIWDSDLDPTESLKIPTDTDMHDWFLERDVKDPAVILHDKLISDALLNGTLPIKSEHSYSLNSDGDSLPDSPRSLQTKMDDMEDECYPAISLKTATSNIRHIDATATIDPKCLTISSSSLSSLSSASSSSSSSSNANCSPILLTTNANMGSGTSFGTSNATLSSQHILPLSGIQSSVYIGLNKMASAPMTFNLRTLENSSHMDDDCTPGAEILLKNLPMQTHIKQRQQYLPQQLPSSESLCCSPTPSTREGSTSPDICSDIEIDESCIKDEPMSPESSCPSSPNAQQAYEQSTGNVSLSLSMSNISTLANSDLVFEHKNGCLQLTPASQNMLKSQHLIIGSSSSANSPNIQIIPKVNIKSETTTVAGSFINSNGTYGLPLTPPSSLPSDDSEGNLTPDHLISPLSPSTTTTVSTTAPTGLTTIRRNTISITATTASASSSSSSSSASLSNCLSVGRQISGASSTRQPIHTPLISSQPKGSTGTLILTEEEKRTLLAEGYPIPQKLPLTKAEEKSLKKIRRKIKNKISAQESRRKKKEYMDQLERRVEILVNENSDFRNRVESLENSNANLLSQLHKLQALINKQNAKKN